MAVDIKRCIEERIVIWCTTKKQANQIWKDFYEYKNQIPISCPRGVGNKSGFEVSCFADMRMPSWQDGYNRTYFISKHGGSKCLDYNEVLLNKIIELW